MNLFKDFFKYKDNKIIYLLFIAPFSHFILTGLIVLGVCLYAIFGGKIPNLFQRKGSILFSIFVIYSIIVALYNSNYIGVACSVGIFAIVIVVMYVREHFTVYNFEKGLNVACYCGIAVSILSAVEYVYNKLYPLDPTSTEKFRATLYFINCNYLATIFGTTIIICCYKIFKRKSNPSLYYITALFCLLGTYLTGSMFVWVEILIGVATLLLTMRRSQILSALLLLAGTACIVIYFMPDLLPRLQQSNVTTDNRMIVWDVTIQAIKKAPIFGYGFLAYQHVKADYVGSYPTTHSHSIFLEPLASFGIIGTLLIIICVVIFYKRVTTCHHAQNKYHMSALAIALSCALFVHSITDLTFLWIQTGLLYGLLFGGIGIEEKMLRIE